MTLGKIFESAVRSTDDLAGVFEYDSETAYFYLYRIDKDTNNILGTIHVANAPIDFEDKNVEIVWDADETMVALFIKGAIQAVFDSRDESSYGGSQSIPIPEHILNIFEGIVT